MLEMMNYFFNNIEKLNMCNLSTNKHSANKSYDNKQRLTELICVCKKKELSKQQCKFFLC